MSFDDAMIIRIGDIIIFGKRMMKVIGICGLIFTCKSEDLKIVILSFEDVLNSKILK